MALLWLHLGRAGLFWPNRSTVWQGDNQSGGLGLAVGREGE